MKVIAISGWKQSGKDTAAYHLINNHGFVRSAFADNLKDMVAKEYDIPREDCDDPDRKELPIKHLPVTPKDPFSLAVAQIMLRELRTGQGERPQGSTTDVSGAFLGITNRNQAAQLYWTPRALCILKGSVNRAVTSDYWVQSVVNKIKTAEVGNFVISDLRYKSEVEQLRQAFGKNLITVRVNRFNTVESNDPSERDLDNATFDVVIENRSSLENFLKQIDQLVKE